MRTPEQIVKTEVLCCASYLVSTLAESSSSEALAEQARSLFQCSSADEREIFGHWIVSDWLANHLAAHGETVDKDFADFAIWGRKTCGQPIYCDGVILEICNSINSASAPMNGSQVA